MKRLLICRHAKSSWKDPDLPDFDRPLNKRGQRDAPEMGRRLAAHGFRPDLICSSPALRAMSTAQLYAGQLGYPLDRIRYNPHQYAATVPVLLQLLQEIEENVQTLMLVGHNPEITALANLLGGLTMDNIPTAGIVALEFGLEHWRGLHPGAGSLLFFDYPKIQG
ncbi:SixA phosphatase family protein [Desulfobulbus propionicus]|jgi:phosphohistidine phosphatase